MHLLQYSPTTLFAEIPTMRAFPLLHDAHEARTEGIDECGAYVRLSTAFTETVQRR